VTVSYFEWVQDLQSFFWSEQEVDDRLDRVMTTSFAAIAAVARTRNIDMRTAAYLVAIDRVAEATRIRGIYP
jgi:glutamate dehydrogenase (NAD(P)+)